MDPAEIIKEVAEFVTKVQTGQLEPRTNELQRKGSDFYTVVTESRTIKGFTEGNGEKRMPDAMGSPS
jgi:hypothetical protein